MWSPAHRADQCWRSNANKFNKLTQRFSREPGSLVTSHGGLATAAAFAERALLAVNCGISDALRGSNVRKGYS
jgi:hypothetical protein